MNRPLQVGITGGIGAGKSLVTHIFHCLGVPIYDADSQARKLMSTDVILRDQIRNEFGAWAYLPDGTPDRAALSKATFGNPKRLEALNNLVHPRVANDYATWSAVHKDKAYVLKEAALLYEAGSYKSMDKMIVVSAPQEVRISRVLKRDTQRNENEVKAIIKSQWPEEEKLKRADHIIYNDDEHMVIPQVLQLHALFMEGSSSGNMAK
jgi:dephospho-CoA kinase